MSSDALTEREQAPGPSAPLVYPSGDVEDTTLADLYGDGPVLVVFYTNDFTPDCVEEWCSFRDYGWFTSGDNVDVIGVSKSRVATHHRFIDYLGLDFPLFSDGDLDIADAFGVTYRTLGVLPRSKRSVFLVDDEGVIRYRWVGDHPLDPTMDQPPLDEIRHAVEELSGEEPETFGFS